MQLQNDDPGPEISDGFHPPLPDNDDASYGYRPARRFSRVGLRPAPPGIAAVWAGTGPVGGNVDIKNRPLGKGRLCAGGGWRQSRAE